MLFNTIDFVIFFITVLTVIALIKNRKFQHVFLLIASYFFFYYSSNYLIVLLIYTTIWDFYFGEKIFRAPTANKKKILLIFSLAGNLGLLGFFKYADFTITQLNILGQYFDLGHQIPLLNWALPIGISFYTFHSITYTVSIYRGQLTPAKSFIDYAIFVAFFPQLVAGPILRAKDFLPQLREKIDQLDTGSKLRQIIIQNQNLKYGITLMAFGFLKKMLFADNISPMVDHIFQNPIGQESFSIILGTIGFGIQIYADFSGYSDIAIGAALILGLKIPVNFNKPYFASSFSDFWQKWHISLSSWLRDYLYIPLGGNRKSRMRTHTNLFIVMFLGGFWHGASWNFVIWGLLHAVYLSVQKILSERFPFFRNSNFFKSRYIKSVLILITQYFVFLAWIAFRVRDFDGMIYSMQKYIFIDFATQKTVQLISISALPLILISLFISLSCISYRIPDLKNRVSNLKYGYWGLFLFSVAIVIFLFYQGHPKDFIYFQF